MVGNEDSLSEVNEKPIKPEMEEEKLEMAGKEGADKRESVLELDESSVNVGGDGNEAEATEGKEVDAKEEKEGVLENLGAAPESELIEPPVDAAEVIEPPVTAAEEVAAGEGGSGVISTRTEDPPAEVKDAEETNGVDDASEPVVNDSVDASDQRGDKLIDDPERKVEVLEEFEPVVESKVEMVVTDSESQMDERKDEMPVEPRVEVEAEKESMLDTDPEVEGVVTDVGDVQQLSELPMDARENEVQAAKEGMEALENTSEREIGHGGDVEAVGGVDKELVDGQTVENNAKMVVDDDKDKVDVKVDNSEIEMSEKEEKAEPEIPLTEATKYNEITEEVNACAVNVSVQEQVHDLGVTDEYVDRGDEHTISEVKTKEDENTVVEALRDSEFDEPANVEENKDESVVKEKLREDDIKTETESEVKLDSKSNVVDGETRLAGAETENEMGTEAEVKLESTSIVVEGETQLADAETEHEMGTDKIEEEEGKVDTEETMSDVDEPGHDMCDSPAALQDEEDEAMVAEEETGTQDTEMETETDVGESGKTSGGKRKRGKLSKSPSVSSKATGKKKAVGEDVCFICFDGGELVLCDRRGCPKAYHPSCVNRDEAFFKSKGRWNCGWHLCSICEKNARYMCFTCTFSLCKSCIKDAVILCVRGNKGFCENCIRTVTLIENNEKGDGDNQVDFDDRSSWEYLFKDYYVELKEKLSITPAEIAEAKNPWKGADMSGASKQESSEAHANDGGSGSDDSIENLEATKPKRRRIRKQPKSLTKGEEAAGAKDIDSSEWASKELLEFVSHMKDGDTSFLSQFDVQALLLDYIKINKLRDPRRKSQIICDARLENLFGKPRVGHFEMLKLLESHFLVRDEPNDDVQGSVVDTDNQIDNDSNVDPVTKGVKDKKRKSRKKYRGPQSNLDDYAAIDMHNIGLIYLRRKLMEDLLEDVDTFRDKVVGTFVRIRISGSTQKQDLYRLVQVVGTSKAPEPYKIGKKTTDTMVEILNLDKTEIISIDTISNQEFTEEECKRLRQSIKCGLLSRLTVGEILDKTTEIQVARVNDWLESETLRLSHLRDRASDMGRRKELRECVEKLQLLKTPEERRRRLEEFPEIHADPKMDPSYESDEDDSENEESRRDAFMRSRGISRRGRGPISPGSDNSVKDSWSGAGKNTSKAWESSRSLSSNTFSINATPIGEIVNENSWNLGRDKDITQGSNTLEKLNSAPTEPVEWASPQPPARPDPFSGVTSSQPSALVETPAVKINESEKMWHYKDPSGKVQGPFSMVQLRKWNNTGYFPADLRIWRNTENEANSILLADALAGKFPKEAPPMDNMFPPSSHSSTKTNAASLFPDNERTNLDQKPGSHSRFNEITRLPSPTPKPSNSSWSNTGPTQSSSVNGVAVLPSPTAVIPNIVPQSSAPASGLNPVMQTAAAFNSPTPNNSQQPLVVGPTASLHGQSTMTAEMHTAQHLHTQPVQQTVIPQNNLQTDSQNWAQPQNYGWGTTPNVQSSSGSFSNPGTAVGMQPDVWRHTQGGPPTPNASWAVAPPSDGSSNNPPPMGVKPENNNPSMPENNPNMGWAPLQQPNMGWGNPAPANTNMNWAPPPAMQAQPPNTGAIAPANPGWAQPPGNNTGAIPPANPAWVPQWGPPGQGPIPGNGWVPPAGGATGAPPNPVQMASVQGNPNQGWGPPPAPGNQGSWGGGPQGGGPRSWNRQSSFGPGGLINKWEMLCPFNANGRCKKGARCDFLHT